MRQKMFGGRPIMRFKFSTAWVAAVFPALVSAAWQGVLSEPGRQVVDHRAIHDRIDRPGRLPEDHSMQRFVLALRDHLVLSPSVHRQRRRRRRALGARARRRRHWPGRWKYSMPTPLGLRGSAPKQVMPSSPRGRRGRPRTRRRRAGRRARHCAVLALGAAGWAW